MTASLLERACQPEFTLEISVTPTKGLDIPGYGKNVAFESVQRDSCCDVVWVFDKNFGNLGVLFYQKHRPLVESRAPEVMTLELRKRLDEGKDEAGNLPNLQFARVCV